MLVRTRPQAPALPEGDIRTMPKTKTAIFLGQVMGYRLWLPQSIRECWHCDEVIEVGHYMSIYWTEYSRDSVQ